MTLPVRAKDYLPGLTLIVRKACRYITKYQGIIQTFLPTVITDPTDLAAVQAMINAIVAGCAVLDKYFPREAS
jgi:hypothetical protein